MITTEKDRWNLSKLKVLRSLARMGDSNSIRIAEATRKTVDATDHTIKRLLGFKHIKIIPYNKNNDGCCNRYALTPKGKKYLKTLDLRFIYSDDLNLKFHPRHIDYTPDTISWKKRNYPPSYVECSGNEYEFKLSQTTKDNIYIYHQRELTFFTKEEKKYAIGDFFKIYDMDTFVIYYVERFTLQEFASIFSRYRSPRDPDKYLSKLQADHPGSQFVYLLYFRKYKPKPQEPTSDQRIKQFLSDKTPTNDNIGNSPENTPQINTTIYYSAFERNITDTIKLLEIDHKILDIIPITAKTMAKEEWKDKGFDSWESYLSDWFKTRNITKLNEDSIIYCYNLQAVTKGRLCP